MNLEPILQSEVSQKEKDKYHISSVQFSHSVVSNSLRPHESQHARPPYPSPTTDAYIWTLERRYWWTYFQGSNRETEQTYGCGGRGGEGEMYGESNKDTYITMCKTDSWRECAVWLRELKQGLCINPQGWDGRETGGRFKRKGTWVCLWLILIDVWQKQQNSVKQLSFN